MSTQYVLFSPSEVFLLLAVTMDSLAAGIHRATMASKDAGTHKVIADNWGAGNCQAIAAQVLRTTTRGQVPTDKTHRTARVQAHESWDRSEKVITTFIRSLLMTDLVLVRQPDLMLEAETTE